MAVIAEPQKINGLTMENQVAIPQVKDSSSLIARIADVLYPDWVIQMAEELRDIYNPKA